MISNHNMVTRNFNVPTFSFDLEVVTTPLTSGVLCRSSAADWRSTTAVRPCAMGLLRDHYCATLETTTKAGPRGSRPLLMWNSAWVWPSMNRGPWIKLPTWALEIHWKVTPFFFTHLKFLFFSPEFMFTILSNTLSAEGLENVVFSGLSKGMWHMDVSGQ